MSIAQTQPSPALPDRSSWLQILGGFQILLGGLCGLMGLMIIFTVMLGPMAAAPQGVEINARTMIPGMSLYFLLAAGFIWLGIGSIRARRWAWTLTVVLSWMWLILGAVSFVFFLLFAKSMMAAAMEQQKLPPQAIAVMQIVTAAIVGCIYVLLPALFLVFYHRDSMRATCLRRDPRIPWTDRCPMPVLALTILHAMSAAFMPSTLATGCVMPVFGTVLSGAAGGAVILFLATVMAYLAWGTYRLRMAAWWGMLLLWTAGTANMLVFSQTGLMEMYEKMKMPAAQLELIRKSGMIEIMSHWMPWLGIGGGAVWLGYLLYVRRYFVEACRAAADRE